MSTIDNATDNQDAEFAMPDELTTLKARADLMNIKYHPSISLEKLRAKVSQAQSDEVVAEDSPAEAVEEVKAAKPQEEESKTAKMIRMRREANELVRIRVTCMNPAKKEWDGEILMVGNSAVGTIKKYVPFNNEEGWHVPRAILNMMRERQCQIFVNGKSKHGTTVRQAKLIKEFAIEVLPNLTKEELQDLAQRQAMAHSVG